MRLIFPLLRDSWNNFHHDNMMELYWLACALLFTRLKLKVCEWYRGLKSLILLASWLRDMGALEEVSDCAGIVSPLLTFYTAQ